MVAGSSMPASRSATRASTARPMKKTSLPSVPVCQPITLVVGPSPEPTYQPVKAEIARTRPDTQVSVSPHAQTSSAGRFGRGREELAQSSGSGGLGL